MEKVRRWRCGYGNESWPDLALRDESMNSLAALALAFVHLQEGVYRLGLVLVGRVCTLMLGKGNATVEDTNTATLGLLPYISSQSTV